MCNLSLHFHPRFQNDSLANGATVIKDQFQEESFRDKYFSPPSQQQSPSRWRHVPEKHRHRSRSPPELERSEMLEGSSASMQHEKHQAEGVSQSEVTEVSRKKQSEMEGSQELLEQSSWRVACKDY